MDEREASVGSLLHAPYWGSVGNLGMSLDGELNRLPLGAWAAPLTRLELAFYLRHINLKSSAN